MLCRVTVASADLAVLGVLRRKTTDVKGVVRLLQNLIPDIWHPSLDVIEAALFRNLGNGTIRYKGGRSPLYVTEAGTRRIVEILNDETNGEWYCIRVLEALQIRFLDLGTNEVVQQFLERQGSKISKSNIATSMLREDFSEGVTMESIPLLSNNPLSVEQSKRKGYRRSLLAARLNHA